MAPATLPVLRCESRRQRPEPRWGVMAAVIVLLASTLDALWLVPAQQRAAMQADPLGPRVRCYEPVTSTPSPTADLRVDGIYLLSAPAR